ncbi:unnamed protein product, partial [Ectocarpus fasciculatus]
GSGWGRAGAAAIARVGPAEERDVGVAFPGRVRDGRQRSLGLRRRERRRCRYRGEAFLQPETPKHGRLPVLRRTRAAAPKHRG